MLLSLLRYIFAATGGSREKGSRDSKGNTPITPSKKRKTPKKGKGGRDPNKPRPPPVLVAARVISERKKKQLDKHFANLDKKTEEQVDCYNRNALEKEGLINDLSIQVQALRLLEQKEKENRNLNSKN